MNPTGKHNLGGHLSALALDAGELLTTDVEIVARDVVLPDNKGTANVALRVTGPVAFLVAKAQALAERDKAKDAYDIVWLIESWPEGPTAAARAFAERPAYRDPAVASAMEAIAYAFAQPDRVGARAYARFVAATIEDEPLLERRAVGALAEFLEALPRHGS